jgi:hypothetical protein
MASEPKGKLDAMTTEVVAVTASGAFVVNGPEDSPDGDLGIYIRWRDAEDNVARLGQRIFKATQVGDFKKSEVLAWLEKNPHVPFHFTPVGSSWLNQVEIWFGVITRQAIRRGTFTSVRTLIRQITDYINTWNADPKSFSWVATADEILAKVKVVEANVRKLIDNNAK